MARAEEFTELKNEIKDVTTATERVPTIQATIEFMKKDMDKFIKADEILNRLSIMYEELSDKIDSRVPIQQFKHVTNNTDKRLE